MENYSGRSHNFATSVGYFKMGIHVVLSFVFVSLKHVFMAIQVNDKRFFFSSQQELMNQRCMMTLLRKVSQISYKVDLGKYATACCTSVFSLFPSNMIIWL